MKVINLTSHTINDLTTGISYPPSGLVIRAVNVEEVAGSYGDLKVMKYTPVLQQKLPDPEENTVYIVSNMALSAIPKDRTDFLGPGPIQKNNETNKPLGCRGFQIA